MNDTLIQCRTTSTTHSVRIRRKWSTTRAMWSTSTCARPHQKCNALIACLIGQKGIVYCTLWKSLLSHRIHASAESKSVRCFSRFRSLVIKSDAVTELDMENLRTYLLSPGLQRVESMSKEERCHRSKFHRNSWQILKDPQHRQSQEENGWDEAQCEEMDKLAKEDHSYTLTRSDFLRYSSNWSFQLNNSGPNKLMASRPDHRTAVQLKNHL